MYLEMLKFKIYIEKKVNEIKKTERVLIFNDLIIVFIFIHLKTDCYRFELILFRFQKIHNDAVHVCLHFKMVVSYSFV